LIRISTCSTTKSVRPKFPTKPNGVSKAIAPSLAKNLKSPGIFAIELFVDKAGEVYVNETAPRVHNSGHHTIEGNYSSQFDMLWRVILGYPLGNTDAILPAAIVNILGAPGYSGKVITKAWMRC
jgi:5-(carboxyamino)imidazole ribonucleotide synthase